MANPTVPAPERQSIRDRLRRELRNPSMMTVFLIIVAVAAIPLALLVPSWVDTTRNSFEDRRAADRLRDSTILSASVLVPSQIAPWMIDQIERMEAADNPADWNFTSFVAGPCDRNNLTQLPPGKFAVAISNSCINLHEIQADHADECPSIQVCNLSDRAMNRLDGVRVSLLNTFADANLVLPYEQEEEASGE